MVRYHFTVHGSVQGVGFRYFARKAAMLHHINGWVRNMLDGTVEIDAEGGEEEMDLFIAAIEDGSRYSFVKTVSREKLQLMENYRSFDIADDE